MCKHQWLTEIVCSYTAVWYVANLMIDFPHESFIIVVKALATSFLQVWCSLFCLDAKKSLILSVTNIDSESVYIHLNCALHFNSGCLCCYDKPDKLC